VLPGVDEDLFAAVSDRAGALLDDWSTDLVRAAEKRVDDPERVRALPDGIDKDYEEGISSLANAVDHGFAPRNVLCTVVAWHNEWQNCLYQMGDRDHMRTVVTKAVRYAELLAQGAVEGRPHLRENQLLAAHYVDRGLLDRDTGKAIAYFELAKEWNPANTNAPQLLEQYRQDALFSTALEHIKARRYPKALAELDRVPRTDATKKTLDRLRTSTLINHGYVLLDAERLDEAERSVRDAERIAAAGDDPKMREEAAKALRAVATGMNNRAVAMSNAALSNLERSVRIGPNAVEGELQAAINLLRRAERIAPEAATRDNITRIEDLLRRLRP
jgi:tetratricopeptide (TPR) repeat protein